MTSLLIILTISCLFCLGYAIYEKIKYPYVKSISQSYYENMPFLLWCWITGFSLLPIWLEITSEDYRFVAFLSCAAMMGLGTVPRSREDQVFQHNLCVTFFSILAVIWMFLSGYWYMACAVLPLMLIFKIWKNAWWAEVVGLIFLYITLYMHLLLNK